MTKALAKEDKLSPRWAKFLETYLVTNNAYQSAIDAGFTEAYAKVITSRYPVKVRSSLKDALEAQGVSSEKIAEKISYLLEHDEYQAVDKGITHAVKIGMGGGYEPEKSVVVTGDIKELADALLHGQRDK